MVNKKLVKEWIFIKDKLTEAKTHELELRKEICEHILEGKIKGSKKGTIDGYVLTATAKMNDKIDVELLKSIWKELSDGEKACIKYKPSLIAAEYKKLKGALKLHRCIDSKPGTPALSLKTVI